MKLARCLAIAWLVLVGSGITAKFCEACVYSAACRRVASVIAVLLLTLVALAVIALGDILGPPPRRD